MNCTNCGREIPDVEQSQFCPFCGAALVRSSITGAADAAITAAPQFYCPWENRDKLGFVAALSQTWTESILRPVDFFKRLPRAGGIGAPLLYALLIGSIGALFSLFWEYQLFDALQRFREWPQGMPFEVNRHLLILIAPFIPIALMVGIFLSSFIYHVCLLITGSAKNGWEATFRVIAYATGPSVFLFVPICGGVVSGIWTWVLQVIGWTHAHDSTMGRVLIAALLPIILCCCFVAVFISMFASLFRDLPIPDALIGQIVHALLP